MTLVEKLDTQVQKAVKSIAEQRVGQLVLQDDTVAVEWDFKHWLN